MSYYHTPENRLRWDYIRRKKGQRTHSYLVDPKTSQIVKFEGWKQGDVWDEPSVLKKSRKKNQIT